MKEYDELINTLENYRETPDGCGHTVLKQSAKAIETLQSVLGEKQRLLDEALDNLAKDSECKFCANIDQCSNRCIERNLAYGGCARWQWRGIKANEKAS